MTLLTKQNWYATLETKNIAPKDPKIVNKQNKWGWLKNKKLGLYFQK